VLSFADFLLFINPLKKLCFINKQFSAYSYQGNTQTIALNCAPRSLAAFS